jgi:hypothetical protein
MVAPGRLDAAASARVRSRLGTGSISGGWSSQDCLYCLLNPVAPVIATAFRGHGFQGRVRNEPLLLKS